MQIYYVQEENQYGPYDLNNFIQLYNDGIVGLNTLIWTETMTNWMILVNSPIYIDIQKILCPQPPPPTRPPSVNVRNSHKQRTSVRFVTESIDLRKSIRRQSSNLNRRSLSQRLTRSQHLDQKKHIWIEDSNDIWVLGSIIHQDNTMLAVQNLKTSEKFIVDLGFKEVLIANEKVVPDMSSLNYMHEPGLLYNLEQRFLSDFPYTYMGLVLLAVNPLKQLPQPLPQDFISKSLNPDIPHPYAIAGNYIYLFIFYIFFSFHFFHFFIIISLNNTTIRALLSRVRFN